MLLGLYSDSLFFLSSLCMCFLCLKLKPLLFGLFYKQGHSQFRRLQIKVDQATSGCDVL